jgi:hypothetical protein
MGPKENLVLEGLQEKKVRRQKSLSQADGSMMVQTNIPKIKLHIKGKKED